MSKLIINNVILDNKAPYENEQTAGNDYRLINHHLMELGYGTFNCNELFQFWHHISDEYGTLWIEVPKNLEDFKKMINIYDEENKI